MTRNPEVWNTPDWVMLNLWRLGPVMHNRFIRIFSIKCYCILPNARIATFTISELLRENHQRVKNPWPRLGLRTRRYYWTNRKARNIKNGFSEQCKFICSLVLCKFNVYNSFSKDVLQNYKLYVLFCSRKPCLIALRRFFQCPHYLPASLLKEC